MDRFERRGAPLPRAGRLLRDDRHQEGRQGQRRPPQRGAAVHGDQLRRREVGLGRQGQGHLRQDGRPALRGRGLPPDGRRLLRPDPAHRGDRRLPAGAAEGPAGGRRAQAAAEDRPGLRARPEAGRGLRRVREAGQHLRPGHALVREAQARPGVHRRQARTLAEKSLYGSAVYHHQQALALKQQGKLEEAKIDLRGRRRRPTRATCSASRGARTPTRCSSSPRSASTTRCSSPRRPRTTTPSATPPRTTSTGRTRPSTRCSPGRSWSSSCKTRRSSPSTRCCGARTGPRARSRKPIPLAAEEKSLIAAIGRLRPALAEGRHARPASPTRPPSSSTRTTTSPRRGKRFETIIKTYPKNEVGQVRHQPHRWRATSSTRTGRAWRRSRPGWPRTPSVIDPKSDLYKDLVKFKLAGRFKLADELMAKGDCDEAAKKYIAAGRRGAEARVRRQGAEQRRGLLREHPPLRVRAQALRAHLPRVPEQQAGRRRALPGGGQRRELATTSTRRWRATSGW